MGVKQKEDTGKPDTGKPYPPRWAVIYALVLVLCAVVWIIRCVIHGDTPWTHHW